LEKKSLVRNKKVIIAGLISSKSDKEELLNPIRKKLIVGGNKIISELIQRRGVSRSKRNGGSNKMDAPLNSKTIMGNGKILELKAEVENKQIEVVVFLNELKKTQKAQIEKIIECEVITVK